MLLAGTERNVRAPGWPPYLDERPQRRKVVRQQMPQAVGGLTVRVALLRQRRQSIQETPELQAALALGLGLGEDEVHLRSCDAEEGTWVRPQGRWAAIQHLPSTNPATYPPCSRPGHSLANFMNMKLSMVSARLCAAVRPKFAYHEKMSCRCSCHCIAHTTTPTAPAQHHATANRDAMHSACACNTQPNAPPAAFLAPAVPQAGAAYWQTTGRGAGCARWLSRACAEVPRQRRTWAS